MPGTRGSELLGGGARRADFPVTGPEVGTGCRGQVSGCRTDTEPGASGEGPRVGSGERPARRGFGGGSSGQGRPGGGAVPAEGSGAAGGSGWEEERTGGGKKPRRKSATPSTSTATQPAAKAPQPSRIAPSAAARPPPAAETAGSRCARRHARTGRALPVPGHPGLEAPLTTSGAPAQSPPCSRPPA